ncbi:Phospholipid ABC transporter substrate-binding protein MlaD [hydrothermal vent metagenome]|uniref:Phospholipid ABC transporter substrate-binding protein MlaD n=1 Tax=hydrothermal vent metagenome TaxID=652676 RepID=A0A3B0ZB74_9ZZZZ
MAKQNMIELSVGVFIAVGIAALAMLAIQVSNLSSFSDSDGYEVVAKFENIGGLKVRSAVSMGGVRLGRVTDVSFDQETFEAVVRIRINNKYNKLPADTTASIFTAGVLGESYIGLEAGAEDETLTDGDEITLTQSAIILEQLIGEFMVRSASQD